MNNYYAGILPLILGDDISLLMKEFDKIATGTIDVSSMADPFKIIGEPQVNLALQLVPGGLRVAVTGSENLDRITTLKNHFCFMLCLNGHVVRKFEKEEFLLEPGVLHLSPPQLNGIFENATADLELYAIQFHSDLLQDSVVRESMIANLLESNLSGTPHRMLTGDRFEILKALFTKLDHETNTPKLFHQQMAKLIFIELFLETSRGCDESPLIRDRHINRPQQLTREFKKLIESHYMTLRSVQDYADLLFVTAKHLSEVVKQETAVAPLHLIHSRIFQESKYWLCASNLTVKEISEKLNFDTSSHFSRFFKQFTGYNPTQFQRIQCAI